MDRSRKPPKDRGPRPPKDRPPIDRSKAERRPERAERPDKVARPDLARDAVARERVEPLAVPRPPVDPEIFTARRPSGDPLAVRMLETDGWDDYRLLDSGHGRKLERYGHVTIVRPEEQAIWSPRLPEATWEAADAQFTGDVEEEGPGRWRFARRMPETWPMRFEAAKFSCRFTSFRHTGVFPEQVAHWGWMADAIARAVKQGRKPKVLNLFGYTGLASLVAASAGAEVTHVDASKKSIAWARENQGESGLDHLPIRWICDDAAKFVARDVRRGARYDVILLDPPKYGRGPDGEVWQLFEHLPEMLKSCRRLLSDDALALVLTVYAMRSSYASFHELAAEAFAGRGGHLASGELFIREAEAPGNAVRRRLATSLFVRWTPEAPE
jgi:23S rRNA (cytosine1962-C5)-methyltransferase